MTVYPRRRLLSLIAIPATALAVLQATTASAAGAYQQTNLVSDIPGLAQHTDRHLLNPWGISSTPASPFWVSDNGAGVATVYANGNPVSIGGSQFVVTIPPPRSQPHITAAPTGTVFNSTSDFEVAKGQPARFLFATEDGTISGWNPNVDLHNAILEVDNSRHGTGAVYKGLTLGSVGINNFIYATNFRSGVVEMYDKNFNLAGTFTDPAVTPGAVTPGFAPFNVQNLGGVLWVTFALQNAAKHDDLSGPGHGFVDVFDTSGNLLRRFAAGVPLNSPWGLAIAPSGFGPFQNDLLVGNFGDGTINAFDLRSGEFRGQLTDSMGHTIVIHGLWGLRFGNGAFNQPTTTLYFTAGINDEMDGLYGSIVSLDN